MPIYDFRCEDTETCKTEFERLLRRAEDPNPACTACGKPTTRLLSIRRFGETGNECSLRLHINWM